MPGPETDALCAKAAELGVWLSIGVSERDAVTGTLYNSNVFISPEGKLHSCHRKLKPTGAERVVWGDADRAFFPVAETPWGVMGSMICWESYMPLARAALYQKGVTLYISPNTNDNEEWQATIRHIALEGRCYFINCDMYFTRDMYPGWLHAPEEVAKLPDRVCRGGSCIVGPDGHYVTEPLWDREGIIYATLGMDAVAASRMEVRPLRPLRAARRAQARGQGHIGGITCLLNSTRRATRAPSARRCVFATRGMVCSSQPLAAQAGLDILRRGGNAVDAAVAAAAVLSVVEPTSNGLGGDAFAQIWSGGRLYGLNSSGPAPALADAAFLREKFGSVPAEGWYAVNVPGIPAAWAEASRRFGRLPFAELLTHAINYAEGGYPRRPPWSRSSGPRISGAFPSTSTRKSSAPGSAPSP